MADFSLAQDATGIYQIRNLLNGKRYVGSAIHISRRWTGHRHALMRGKHHSRALQRAWNKYGPQSFAFEVVELCDKESLIAREQAAIDQKSEYNICPTAGSLAGLPLSSESRAKISARMRGNSYTKGWKYSPEQCERMAAPKRGRKRPPMSAETKAKLSAAMKGKPGMRGRVVSPETREKLRSANIGKKKTLGQLQFHALLTEDVIRRIFQMRMAKKTYPQIGKALSVNFRTVKRVCLRERYWWVAPEIPALTQQIIGRGGWTRDEKIRQKPRTPEHCANISKGLVGVTRTEEQKAKISAALKGRVFPHMLRPRSAEWRRKLSEANIGKHHGLGLKKSAEHRANLSLAKMGVPNPKIKELAERRRREQQLAYAVLAEAINDCRPAGLILRIS